MREDYFMNYDFLRKHGDKVDKNGKCFRMLDFEDGGMYFGIVEEELPSGLGAFVYSDLKFHCGYYRGGLMNDMSRIHFGNGDVYDGMTQNGKMHGEGFFFDCENNDWVFGLFETDNCVEVIEHGEGFPRSEITKFRALYHQSESQFYGRETEPLQLDLDILIEYANRDISHLRPEIIPNTLRTNSDNNELEEPDAEEANEEEQLEVDEAEEVSKKSSLYHREQSNYQAHLPEQNLEENSNFSASTKHDEMNFKEKLEKKEVSGVDHLRKEYYSSNNTDSKVTSRFQPKKQDIETQLIERKFAPVPEVNTVSPSLLGGDTLRTPMKGGREILKKTPGNQIVQGANLIKPKPAVNYRENVAHFGTEQENGIHQQSKYSNHMKMNDISGVSSVREHNESRDLRNISIQTEDKMGENYYKNDEASISYLKGIHSMIDELKQMVSDKIVIGRETEKVEESILFKITEVKKQVEQSLSGKNYPPFLDKEIPILPFQADSVLPNFNYPTDLGSVLIDTSNHYSLGLPPETRLPQSMNSSSPGELGTFWNMTIDRKLEEKRLRDIEEALAKKFGKSEEYEKPTGETLEPIKESADGEEDDEANLGRSSKMDLRGISQERVNLAAIWQGAGSEEYKEELFHHMKDTKTEEMNLQGINYSGHVIKLESDLKSIEPRVTPREPFQEVITEADEKTFYTGEPVWGIDKRKSSWTGFGGETPDINSQKTNTFKSKDSSYPIEVAKNGEQLKLYGLEVEKDQAELQNDAYLLTTEPNTGKFLSFGKKVGQRPEDRVLPDEPGQRETDPNRDSNFMQSRKGNESKSNGSLLPGPALALIPPKVSSMTPWFFLNPYLYEAMSEIDVSQY